GFFLLSLSILVILSQVAAVGTWEPPELYLPGLLLTVLPTAVMLSILRNNRLLSLTLIIVVAALLWSGWSLYASALDFPENFRFRWKTWIDAYYGLHNFPIFALGAFSAYLLLTGFAIQLQELHKEV